MATSTKQQRPTTTTLAAAALAAPEIKGGDAPKTTEQPATDQSATEQPSTEQPSTEQPAPDRDGGGALAAARAELRRLNARYNAAIDKGAKQVAEATKAFQRVVDATENEILRTRREMQTQQDVVRKIEIAQAAN